MPTVAQYFQKWFDLKVNGIGGSEVKVCLVAAKRVEDDSKAKRLRHLPRS